MLIMYMMMPLCVILAVAVLTLLERRMLGNFQSSMGPDSVGMFGMLQPIADALKLLFKEMMVPGMSNLMIFMLAPMLMFLLSLMNWSVMPMFYGNVLMNEMNMGFLFMFAVSSLGVYGMMMAGWASNSKYAFLGALRSAAQMMSYEVSIGIMMMMILLYVGSFNLTTMVESQMYMWNMFVLYPCFMLFFVSALAETNSVPFDLPEAESELVSGYNVEYSAFTFALFFLAEYSNIMLMSFLMVLFFFGGWLPFLNVNMLFFLFKEIWMVLKVLFMMYLFILVSGTLPRYSYDQLMSLGWKMFLPLSLSYLLLYMMFIYYFFLWN